MQRKWYRSVLEKDLEAVNGELQSKENFVVLTTTQASQGKRRGKLA
jgi:hypothetical protein